MLKVETWRAAYRGLLPGPILDRLDAAEEASAWAAYLRHMPRQDRLWVVADEDTGRLVGYARTGPCRDPDVALATGEVHGLYVAPERIGTGLGRVLLGHAVADLRQRGLDPVVLWHFARNDRAAGFYGRAGFALDGARRISGLGADEVRRTLRRAAPSSSSPAPA